MLSEHALALAEFQRLLAKPGVSVLSQKLGSPAPTYIQQLRVPRAKVYVIDAHGPRPATEALVAAIHKRYKQAYLLFVRENFDRKQAFSLLRLGAKGLLSYADTKHQLARALQAVARGGFWVPRELLSSFVDSVLRSGRRRPGSNWSAQLSARETQVLDELLGNMSNKEIAAKLKISERTVKFHVSNVLSKFGVGRRADLIVLCHQQGPQ